METHELAVVEITEEYAEYGCPKCPYRARQWFGDHDPKIEYLFPGDGSRHVGMASGIVGVSGQVGSRLFVVT